MSTWPGGNQVNGIEKSACGLRTYLLDDSNGAATMRSYTYLVPVMINIGRQGETVMEKGAEPKGMAYKSQE
jgi:hypothetical protein